MKKIWTSSMRKQLKVRLFRATVESILFYGSETWTITKSLAKKLDVCCSRMLRMALDVKWQDKISNENIFGDLPRATNSVQKRRMGHIARHDDLIANK